MQTHAAGSGKQVRISVVTATWNCVSTVADCLQSVASQTHPAVEHVVVDGVSSDGTLELLQANRERIAVLHSGPDTGIYDALNTGVRLASGDVVGFLHADDVYADAGVLERVALAFSDPLVSAVYGDLQYVRKDDMSHVVRNWQSGAFRRWKLRWGWMPPHPTLYVRREWYERIGGFDTRYRIAADYASILQLFSHSEFKALHLAEVLVRMRLGGASNRSARAVLNKMGEDWRALRESGAGVAQTATALVGKNLSKLGQFL